MLASGPIAPARPAGAPKRAGARATGACPAVSVIAEPRRTNGQPAARAALHVDARDLHPQVLLPVALLLVIALAALVLLDGDLVALLFADDVGRDGRVRHQRRADFGR